MGNVFGRAKNPADDRIVVAPTPIAKIVKDGEPQPPTTKIVFSKEGSPIVEVPKSVSELQAEAQKQLGILPQQVPNHNNKQPIDLGEMKQDIENLKRKVNLTTDPMYQPHTSSYSKPPSYSNSSSYSKPPSYSNSLSSSYRSGYQRGGGKKTSKNQPGKAKPIAKGSLKRSRSKKSKTKSRRRT